MVAGDRVHGALLASLAHLFLHFLRQFLELGQILFLDTIWAIAVTGFNPPRPFLGVRVRPAVSALAVELPVLGVVNGGHRRSAIQRSSRVVRAM